MDEGQSLDWALLSDLIGLRSGGMIFESVRDFLLEPSLKLWQSTD